MKRELRRWMGEDAVYGKNHRGDSRRVVGHRAHGTRRGTKLSTARHQSPKVPEIFRLKPLHFMKLGWSLGCSCENGPINDTWQQPVFLSLIYFAVHCSRTSRSCHLGKPPVPDLLYSLDATLGQLPYVHHPQKRSYKRGCH